ncbi:hypothetical protein ACHAQD_012430 [Fusarium lateritium]
MPLFPYVWLIAGLIPSLGLAEKANLEIWEVYESCKAEEPYVQESIDIVLEIAIAARESLEFLSEEFHEHEKGSRKYMTIHKTVAAIFGIIAQNRKYNVSM